MPVERKFFEMQEGDTLEKIISDLKEWSGAEESRDEFARRRKLDERIAGFVGAESETICSECGSHSWRSAPTYIHDLSYAQKIIPQDVSVETISIPSQGKARVVLISSDGHQTEAEHGSPAAALAMAALLMRRKLNYRGFEPR